MFVFHAFFSLLYFFYLSPLILLIWSIELAKKKLSRLDRFVWVIQYRYANFFTLNLHSASVGIQSSYIFFDPLHLFFSFSFPNRFENIDRLWTSNDFVTVLIYTHSGTQSILMVKRKKHLTQIKSSFCSIFQPILCPFHNFHCEIRKCERPASFCVVFVYVICLAVWIFHTLFSLFILRSDTRQFHPSHGTFNWCRMSVWV